MARRKKEFVIESIWFMECFGARNLIGGRWYFCLVKLGFLLESERRFIGLEKILLWIDPEFLFLEDSTGEKFEIIRDIYIHGREMDYSLLGILYVFAQDLIKIWEGMDGEMDIHWEKC